MCYFNLSVEMLDAASNYPQEESFSDLMLAGELCNIMPEYPEGYLVISANGIKHPDIEVVLSPTLI